MKTYFNGNHLMDWWENTCQQWPHCWQGLEWLSERSSTLSPSLRTLSTSWEEEEPDFCFWSDGGEIESLWSTSTIPQSLQHQSIWLSILWNGESMTYHKSPIFSEFSGRRNSDLSKICVQKDCKPLGWTLYTVYTWQPGLSSREGRPCFAFKSW